MPKSNVFKKRVMKTRGFLNLASSALLLRYTRFNRTRLLKQLRKLRIDRLHVGCGKMIVRGWLNMTYEPRERYGEIRNMDGSLWLNYDVRKKLPFDDSSIQFIAGSHFIEHLDLNDGLDFFKEAFRVMKTNGIIRISCPDLGIYIHSYITKNQEFFNHPLIREACTFKNAATPGGILAAKAYDSGGSHKWFYDFETLKHSLEAAGFSHVKKVSLIEGQIPDLEKIELPAREIETLYVEAVKL